MKENSENQSKEDPPRKIVPKLQKDKGIDFEFSKAEKDYIEEYINKKLGTESRLSTVEERMKHFPTFKAMFISIFSMMIALFGLIGGLIRFFWDKVFPCC